MSRPRPGTCRAPGPSDAHCTDDPGHRYSCYDAGEDLSFNDGQDFEHDCGNAACPDNGSTAEDPVTAVDRPDNGHDEGRKRAYLDWYAEPRGYLDYRVAFTAGWDAATRSAVADSELREQVATELGRHQHLMGRRDDDQPQWYSWCDCGWDGGPVEPGRGAPADVRAAFRLHVAEGLLSLLVTAPDTSETGAAEPCRVYSDGPDGWHCAVTGPHDVHRNAAGDVTWGGEHRGA